MSLHSGDILAVDDNPANLDLLGGLLREQGYKVRSATSGKRALEAALKARPELIILDINMPEMDGYETCRQLKMTPFLASVPVIFISALDGALDKVKAFDVGGADYLSKPFQPQEVVARVEHQLCIFRLEQELVAKNRVLQEANLRLRELDQLKSSFTAMLVHDIRSPLTPVGLALEHYRFSGSIPEVMLAQCENCIRKVSGMLHEMLEVFQSEGGEFPVELSPISPETLLAGLRSAFSIEAKKRGLVFEVVGENLPPAMLGDFNKLDRTLVNLIANAFKFTSEGGKVTLKVDVKDGAGVDAGHRWLRFEVTDTGRGIPPHQLPYVFDPYRQSVATDRDLGVGLGLAIVQRIVAAHKGRVTVQSQVGVGTTFTILLPIQGA